MTKVIVIVERLPEEVRMAVDAETGRTAEFGSEGEAMAYGKENCSWKWDVLTLIWEDE